MRSSLTEIPLTQRLFEISTTEARDVLLMGRANAGKTSLLNSVLPRKHQALTSPMPGTTLGASCYVFSRFMEGQTAGFAVRRLQQPLTV